MDEWIEIEKINNTKYRNLSKFIEEWTPIVLSYQTVKTVLERAENLQNKYNQALIEGDGVYLRSIKKKNIKIHHAITYEGWEKKENERL